MAAHIVPTNGKYRTFTIVVRDTGDLPQNPATMSDLIAMGDVMFLGIEEGLTTCALDLGADPGSWDDVDDEAVEDAACRA